MFCNNPCFYPNCRDNVLKRLVYCTGQKCVRNGNWLKPS